MGVLVKNGKSYTGTGDLLIQPVIYSDDERCIGVWRDGKPLYQKTIVFDSEVTLSNTTWNELPKTDDIYNIVDSIVMAVGNGASADSQSGITRNLEVSRDSSTNYLRAITVRAGNDYFSMVTLQYTKTTDTAGTAAWVPTGAAPIHYSLNEQVIGTWIDGKPLYQKSFVVTESSTVTISNSSGQSISGFTSEYASQIAPTIDKLIDAFTKNNMSSSDVLTSWPIRIKKANGYIFPTDNSGVSYINYNINPNTVITIRYTKTTD